MSLAGDGFDNGHLAPRLQSEDYHFFARLRFPAQKVFSLKQYLSSKQWMNNLIIGANHDRDQPGWPQSCGAGSKQPENSPAKAIRAWPHSNFPTAWHYASHSFATDQLLDLAQQSGAH
jgi:hypothetical protein